MFYMKINEHDAGLAVDRRVRRRRHRWGAARGAAARRASDGYRGPSRGAAPGAYILFGAGLAAFAPGMLSLVADVMPPNRLGQAYGWYTTAIYIAMTLGPAAGGYLAKTVGLRNVFVVSGSLLAVVALVAVFVLPKGPPRHKTDLHAALSASFELLHHRRLLACLLATVGSCIGFGVFLTFLPLYAAQQGYDPAQVGLIFACPGHYQCRRQGADRKPFRPR